MTNGWLSHKLHHVATESKILINYLICTLFVFAFVFLLVGHAKSTHPSDQLSKRLYVPVLQCSEDAEIKRSLTHLLGRVVYPVCPDDHGDLDDHDCLTAKQSNRQKVYLEVI